MRPLVRILAPLAALVLLLPGLGVAAVQRDSQDPPDTTPTETSPPPADPAQAVETVVTPDEPTGSNTITIVVSLQSKPAPKRAAVRAHAAPPVRKSPAKAARRVPGPAAESHRSSPRFVAPPTANTPTQADKPAKAAKAAKARAQRKPSRPKHSAPPLVSRPAVTPVADHTPAAGVLAAQFSSAPVDPPAPGSNTIVYLALTLGALLAMLLAVVAAAPNLALLWPRVFVPVIRAQEQLLLAVACVVCVAITLAITWVLTGPGA